MDVYSTVQPVWNTVRGPWELVHHKAIKFQGGSTLDKKNDSFWQSDGNQRILLCQWTGTSPGHHSVWASAESGSCSEPDVVSLDGAGADGVFWAGAVPASSSRGVSWEPPRTEQEFESGGTDPETQLGAGLHSPDALAGVWPWVCFFLRSVSIQLELCLEAKEVRAKDESLMFLPEVISSPKPSWWAKA